MKKVLALILLLFFGTFVTGTANSFTEVKHSENDRKLVTENIGVSIEPQLESKKDDEGISPLGLTPPGSEHNIFSDGRMYFAGEAEISSLYTNKKFTGSSSYKIQMRNYSDSRLRVDIMKPYFLSETVVKTYYISPNSTGYGYPSGLDPEEGYYLRFHAPSNFEGYVDY
ncbi:hypothetical protein FZC79_15000 [Rossellomorea vietnamensis]|uniref:Uncharacterized protein n=1 Tax=Rossellomorea vietnamensis TaxID=218284 RepID=A0A5D4KBZ1_9BACI|nr:hypothetical protein [Rossellomorea vietnamensis]TYR74389.1 hypothetical protein FZC79_15000 [Rossellomorea vietnamensis]